MHSGVMVVLLRLGLTLAAYAQLMVSVGCFTSSGPWRDPCSQPE
ncbi:hypothetical protein [Aquabacterium sp. CECT 9606]|nr:hypothetical protein [Aquabacterium sp. CECT 9606]CAH0351730.1 hypothetical protein AQB9606_02395 [Aquabacterium sp. CECT 9606]